jgi:DNA ligase-4
MNKSEEDHIEPSHYNNNNNINNSTNSTTSPSNQCDAFPYTLLCQYLDKISDAKTSQKRKFLIAIWTKYSKRENLFPLMRLLLPQLDTENNRHNYGLREAGLAEMYINALGLTKESESAQIIINYKNPRRMKGLNDRMGVALIAGDFSSVLYSVLKNYLSIPDKRGSRHTLGEINSVLNAIANAPDKETRKRIFMNLTSKLSPREHFWLTRIILKDLKIGQRQESMLKLFHPKALDIFNSCSSLAHVCELVANPAKLAAEVGKIQYFHPFKPMLCSNQSIESIIQIMDGLEFVIEDKFDGERLLIHKEGQIVKLYSRNSVDHTTRYNYGAVFTPIILQALDNHNCILDGELLSYNTITNKYEPFGSNRTTALASIDVILSDTSKQLCYKAFDILAWEANVLTDQPLKQRKETLNKVIQPIKHQFEIVDYKVCQNLGSAEIFSSLENSLSRGKEGIIVKNYSSPYLLANRGNAWIKVKPDYIHGMRDNLDVLIVGSYYGEGMRRSGDISHFLLAVAKDFDRSKQEQPDDFLVFGKVGSGYSIPELAALRNRLKDSAVKWPESTSSAEYKKMPSFLREWKFERQDRPDFYYLPRDSVILELKCGEVVPCEYKKFSAGYTARFPRTQRFRYDKSWYECMTLAEVLALNVPRGAAARSAHNNNARNGEEEWERGSGGYNSEEESAETASRWTEDASSTVTRASNQPSGEQNSAENNNLFAGEWGIGANNSSLVVKEDHFQPNSQPPPNSLLAQIDLGLPSEGSAQKKRKGRGKKDHSAAATGEEATEAEKARKRGRGNVLAYFQGASVTDVQRSSEIFSDCSFCVMSTDFSPSKAELERIIAANGGNFTQNPLTQTTTAIISKKGATLKVNVQIKQGNFDIIHYQWLLDSVKMKTKLPYYNKYIIYVTPSTQTALENLQDEFGDAYDTPLSYNTHINSGESAETIGSASEMGDSMNQTVAETREQVRARYKHPFEANYDPSTYISAFQLFSPEDQAALAIPARLFNETTLKFMKNPNEINNNPTGKMMSDVNERVAEVAAQLFGARIVRGEEEAAHKVLISAYAAGSSQANKYPPPSSSTGMLSSDWLFDSIKEETLLDPTNFKITNNSNTNHNSAASSNNNRT